MANEAAGKTEAELSKARNNVRYLESVAAAKAKAERGDVLTAEDRAALLCELALNKITEIHAEMKTRRLSDTTPQPFTRGHFGSIILAIERIIVDQHAMAAAQAEKRQALEDRITALEEAATQPGGGGVKI